MQGLKFNGQPSILENSNTEDASMSNRYQKYEDGSHWSIILILQFS